jgi:hypothetical protein
MSRIGFTQAPPSHPRSELTAEMPTPLATGPLRKPERAVVILDGKRPSRSRGYLGGYAEVGQPSLFPLHVGRLLPAWHV